MGRTRHRHVAGPVRLVVVMAGLTVALTACTTSPTVTTSTISPPSTSPPSTTAPASGGWPVRPATSTGTVQDIAPTGPALYWLAVTGAGTETAATVTPVRYDLLSHRVTSGAAVTGIVGSPALTVTGGWVWVVIGQGANAVLEQLDPVTLAADAERPLSVTDTLSPSQSNPLLTATVGGPLWVAAGEDVWEVDPSTGIIENEFDAGDQISSMSTDPAGTLLYTGGGLPPGQYGMVVSEYDARGGRLLDRSYQRDAVNGGTVAATNGGVWVSYRTGMAGPALELSSDHLNKIEPPTDPNGPFGTFDQIMGVSSAVSDGVLWLSSTNALTCADPTTSVVRARDTTDVLGPVASGGLLYAASPSGGVEVITPPTLCFGNP